jgi:hypothetical protein
MPRRAIATATALLTATTRSPTRISVALFWNSLCTVVMSTKRRCRTLQRAISAPVIMCACTTSGSYFATSRLKPATIAGTRDGRGDCASST